MATPLMTALEQTVNFIKSKIDSSANTAIILGSGLGNLSKEIQIDFSINYNSICILHIFYLPIISIITMFSRKMFF